MNVRPKIQTTYLGIKLPIKLKEQIEKAATRTGESMSVWIRSALRAALKGKQ